MTVSRSAGRTAGFALLYVIAMYAGRQTVIDSTNLSLVWPAAGLLAVWFVVQRRSRWRWLDVVALAAITVAVDRATGASPALALWFVVPNLLQAFVFTYLFDRWLPGLWIGPDGGRPMSRLHELWHLVAAHGAQFRVRCGDRPPRPVADHRPVLRAGGGRVARPQHDQRAAGGCVRPAPRKGGAVARSRSTGAPVPRFEIGPLGAVDADPVLTRQLLENLVGNAVRYTAPGTTPSVAITSVPEPDGFVRVHVDDNGIGIPADQRDAVFDNFHRAHRSGGYPGSGLGLTICKRIVERHGGTIRAGDTPDHTGTRITFTLPA